MTRKSELLSSVVSPSMSFSRSLSNRLGVEWRTLSSGDLSSCLGGGGPGGGAGATERPITKGD
jgi:hypothetical protein